MFQIGGGWGKVRNLWNMRKMCQIVRQKQVFPGKWKCNEHNCSEKADKMKLLKKDFP